MLTDCSSIQGSTASSSSEVMTLATTSSWCAISIPSSAAAAVAASTRLRILRLIRPHARRILVTPDTSPSFGFAVRGGKEFGTGFFVSSVERNSEAELKGMRVGDQILRINGFRIDDAVHRELIQFITNQDRITMKVRSVGMLPIKEKDTDKLSWHAVKTFTNGSSASSESSYRTLPERDTRSKNVNVTLNVAPRTKLGLGICKGPEWKPGIFVQFTKEKSVAREAGLRQGDQILSVNSIDFSDVLFSEAVAVMKSASKLEMVVRTAAGCDLFPGESSGYNSSASSVTGDQSPCWADAKSKRLTSVREEPSPATCLNEAAYAEHHRRGEQQAGSSKQRKDAQEKKPVGSQQQQVNKTIIKLSEQGTSINNTFVSNTQQPMTSNHSASEYGTTKVRGAVGSHDTQPMNVASSSAATYASREEPERKTVVVEVHRQEAEEAKRQQQLQLQMQQKQSQPRTELNGHYHSHSHNQSHNIMQPAHSLPNHTPPTKQPELRKCLRTNSYSQHQQQQQQQHHQPQQQGQAQKLQQQQQGSSHGHNTCQVDSSSLSSAITEELKKRKEKQRINAATANNNNNNSNNNNNNNTNDHSNYMNISSKQNNYGQSRQQQHQQQHHHHTLHQQVALKPQQQQTHCHSTPLSPSSSSLSLSAPTTTPAKASSSATAAAPASTTLSARATSNTVNGSERNNHSHNKNNNSNSNQSVPATGTLAIAGVGVGVGVGAGDQHSALMDEFKRAHQRMFKNGFQETERKERQDALRNTAIMEDDVNHRASRAFRNDNGPATTNGTQFQIPPPPPQFAGSPPRTQPQYANSNSTNKFAKQPQPQAQQKPINHYNNCAPALKPPTEQPPKPPATPVPDYDNVEVRTKATTISSSVRPSYGYASTNIVTNGRDIPNDNNSNYNSSCNRRTLRAGTITIGEYELPQQRREPGKFDFVGTPKRIANGTTDVCTDNLQAELQSTLTRSKLKKSSEPLEHQSNCPLRNNYENYENVARKLHSVSINEIATTSPPAVKMSNCTSNGGTNGILKNGNRHSGGANGAKSSDKTITFGN